MSRQQDKNKNKDLGMSIQSYRSYIYAIDDLIKEIKDQIATDDRKFIKEHIKKIGKDAYWVWFLTHIDDIKKYVESAPSRRQNTKKWNVTETKQMIMLAAIHYLQSSQQLLIVTNELITTDERSNRGIAGIAGESFFLITQCKIKYYML
jgi:hypothetical protein